MKVVAAFFALFVAVAAVAQNAATPASRAHIQFTVENPKLEPVQHSLEIYEDGTGRYTATYTAADGDSAALPVDRPVRVHDPLLSHLFESARSHHLFAEACQAPHSHVAFTGKKTLAYTGPDGAGGCTFNYARDPAINQVAGELMAVAYTLEIGERLQRDHRYDPLSLDAELGSLRDAAQNGQALELENIAPELESIANDGAVMSRARERARSLLPEPGPAR
ncbi:MAG: hypothetical protein WA634_09995 [Silvibacterium sp.]